MVLSRGLVLKRRFSFLSTLPRFFEICATFIFLFFSSLFSGYGFNGATTVSCWVPSGLHSCCGWTVWRPSWWSECRLGGGWWWWCFFSISFKIPPPNWNILCKVVAEADPGLGDEKINYQEYVVPAFLTQVPMSFLLAPFFLYWKRKILAINKSCLSMEFSNYESFWLAASHFPLQHGNGPIKNPPYMLFAICTVCSQTSSKTGDLWELAKYR